MLSLRSSESLDRLADNLGLMLKNQLSERADTIDANIRSSIELIRRLFCLHYPSEILDIRVVRIW